MNELIDRVKEDKEVPQFTWAVINTVACYPGKDEYGNFNKPHKKAVQACEPRLRSFFELCDPKLLVALGAVADKKLPIDIKVAVPYLPLLHPAAIRRTEDPREYTLRYNRFVLCLSEAIKEYILS